MPVTAIATRTLRAKPAEAFEKFIDFRNWQKFMPPEFRPVSGPDRPLKPGDRVKMRLDAGVARLPVPVDVFSMDAPREVVWGGGSKLLYARHRFVFSDAGDGRTLVESSEEWTGMLCRITSVARRVKRQAEVVAEAQLAGFARWVEAD
jgi:hypothetical protein